VLERMNKSKNRDSIYRLERKIGIYLTLLNLLAFMIGLDLTNAVFLFISTFFGVSMIIGPFVCENKPGMSIGSGIKKGSLQGFLRSWGDRVADILGLITAGGLIALLNIKIHSASIITLYLWPVILFIVPLVIFSVIIIYVLPNYNPVSTDINEAKLKNRDGKDITIKNNSDLKELINNLNQLSEDTRHKIKLILRHHLMFRILHGMTLFMLSNLLRINIEKTHGKYNYSSKDNLSEKQIKLEKERYSRFSRILWEFSRFVVIGLTAFMFFGIVPLPDYFLMSLGSTILKVTMPELITAFAGIFGLIMATIILGKIYGAYRLNQLNDRYIQFVKDFESIRDSLDFELRSTIEARKQQIRIFFHQEAYKYIEEALEELNVILKSVNKGQSKNNSQGIPIDKTSTANNVSPAAASVENIQSPKPSIPAVSASVSPEIDSIIKELRKSLSPDSTAPPRVERKDNIVDVVFNITVPAEKQGEVKEALLKDIREGRLAIKVQDAQGR